MFEDLRKDGEDSPFFKQQDEFDPLLDAPAKKKRGGDGGSKKGGGSGIKLSRNFLGMTPFQRFAISLALFMMVCFVGAALLFVAGSVVIF